MNKITGSLLLVGLCVSGVTAQELKLPYYSTHPAADPDYSYFCKKSFPNGQPNKVLSPQELDVRSCDISSWDLTPYTARELADVLTFDSQTKFPPKQKLPKGFKPRKILQHGKGPGLGVKALHKKGITGKGVSVAVIDQNLLLEHQEYQDQVVYYEEDKNFWRRTDRSSMHAPAVVSIAAGKKVGVAPQARVFAFAPSFGETTDKQYDARPTAQALRRITELNSQLPADKKIRVVSISRGFSPHDNGSAEFEAAKQALEKDGVAVFTTNDVHTLSRNHSLDDPENAANYCRMAYWFGKGDVKFLAIDEQEVVVPTDFRVISSETGPANYVHYANGGLSWAVPYVAGLYALGAQVYPRLTKEIFVNAVHETATVRSCEYEGEKFSMPLVNPSHLINYLRLLNTQN